MANWHDACAVRRRSVIAGLPVGPPPPRPVLTPPGGVSLCYPARMNKGAMADNMTEEAPAAAVAPLVEPAREAQAALLAQRETVIAAQQG